MEVNTDMNDTDSQTCEKPFFHTFSSLVWDYLIKVRDKPARLFGLCYLDFLQDQYRGKPAGLMPAPRTPAQRLVRVELNRLYQNYYGKELA